MVPGGGGGGHGAGRLCAGWALHSRSTGVYAHTHADTASGSHASPGLPWHIACLLALLHREFDCPGSPSV